MYRRIERFLLDPAITSYSEARLGTPEIRPPFRVGPKKGMESEILVPSGGGLLKFKVYICRKITPRRLESSKMSGFSVFYTVTVRPYCTISVIQLSHLVEY